ncbi:DUF262 domain-containing protein [Clostridium sp. BSD9I1]|uniref:DUF262 domain-containing protein n=1 Tax=Clostridium sp. BSD9I1 TaxID=2003589 RepID=UPI001644020F|nr:DUF262 domain-containing protein [Clostridium sp. BSD9I1]
MGLMMAFSFDSRPIQTISNQILNYNKRDGIDLKPVYQRGYIWSSEFKDKLIYSIVKGYPIGNISLRVRNERNLKGAMQEVVDGQQRLTTIFNFTKNDYVIQGDYSRKIIEYIVEYMGDDQDPLLLKLKKRLNNKGKTSLRYEQLPEIIKGNINAYNISITNITNASDDEIIEYFRFLQNQERLRAGEIINSVPETALDVYLNQLKDKSLFLQKVDFDNSRRQFDRVFYSILGLLDGRIGFGVTDKVVLNYSSECKDLSPLVEEQCSLLINQINFITDNIDISIKYIKSNARLMKFFLLLTALNLVDFTEDTKDKLKALDSVNEKLSSFSSAKADSVKLAFNGYSNEVIEEFRLIALISKGGHSFNRVKNRMEILSYYINNFKNKVNPSGVTPN